MFRPDVLPDHLTIASELILTRMLERLGFELVCTYRFSYLLRDPVSIANEVVKIFLPNCKARLRGYF